MFFLFFPAISSFNNAKKADLVNEKRPEFQNNANQNIANGK